MEEYLEWNSVEEEMNSIYHRYFFAGGSYEVRDEVAITSKTYYAIGGMTVAMYDSVEDELMYMASDHLTSASVMINTNGQIESEQRYMPFGEVRLDVGDTIMETDLGYTGQRNYSYIKLNDYNARWYSPKLGRFIQPDSIIPGMGNSQAWDRYSYVLNSPVKYSDPTGNNHYDPGCECMVYTGDGQNDNFHQDNLEYDKPWLENNVGNSYLTNKQKEIIKKYSNGDKNQLDYDLEWEDFSFTPPKNVKITLDFSEPDWPTVLDNGLSIISDVAKEATPFDEIALLSRTIKLAWDVFLLPNDYFRGDKKEPLRMIWDSAKSKGGGQLIEDIGKTVNKKFGLFYTIGETALELMTIINIDVEW